MNHSRRGLLCCAAISIVSFSSINAQPASQQQDFDIPSQELKYSLRDLSKQVGLELSARSGDLDGTRAPALCGRYSTERALQILLAGSGLSAEIHDGAIQIRGRSQPAVTEPAEDFARNSAIVVTGSRIEGTKPVSTLITITQEQMRRSGQNDLGQVIRSLPQNFAGGQSPGIGLGALGGSGNSQNVNGGSALNLRGLGPDASLTLINGHRISYGSFTQAVDIASIPLAAVDRIEIMPDGASAIYGSDAVAGVANVLLKRDFNGVEARGRLGSATDGGNFQQEYSVTTGTQWQRGGVLIAYDFERDTHIRSDQRSYTSYMPLPNDLLPIQKHHSAIAAMHEAFTDTLSFSIDAAYSNRKTMRIITSSISQTTGAKNELYNLAPTLKLDLGDRNSLSLSGVYGRDKTLYTASGSIIGGPSLYDVRGCYCNTLKSIEFGGSHSTISFPGGIGRIAAGVGYRETHFDSHAEGSSTTTTGTQKNLFAYGETFVPVIAESSDVPSVRELFFTAAIRYEKYDGIGDVVVPRLGAVLTPVAGLSIKGSWGKSFKAPTLQQLNQPVYVYLYTAQRMGATGYPATATALLSSGGNSDLQPERSTNWSTTFSFKPETVRNLSLDVTYFSIHYRSRIIQPIANTAATFGNAANTDFITYNPIPASQANFIAPAIAGLINNAGTAYDPSTVIALARNQYTNVARQNARGVDLMLGYGFAIGEGKVDLNLNGSWFESAQKNARQSLALDLAGTVYNPPHIVGRSGAVWVAGPTSLGAFVNYRGRVRDTRSASSVRGSAMTTFDLTASRRIATNPNGQGVELSLSVLNVANAKPPYLRYTATSYENYDSTNYSPVGRFVSASAAWRW